MIKALTSKPITSAALVVWVVTAAMWAMSAYRPSDFQVASLLAIAIIDAMQRLMED